MSDLLPVNAPVSPSIGASSGSPIGSAELGLLQQLLHEAQSTLAADPWRAHARLDAMAELLGARGRVRVCAPLQDQAPQTVPQPRLAAHSPVADLPPAPLRCGPVRGGLAPWQLARVRQHVQRHIDQPLPLEGLAGLVRLSRGHFCRAFKISTGEAPHAFVTRQRIGHAQHLMLTTSDTLGMIAPACGFADQAHLTRLFRKWVGMTPRNWRRTHLRSADRGRAIRHLLPVAQSIL